MFSDPLESLQGHMRVESVSTQFRPDFFFLTWSFSTTQRRISPQTCQSRVPPPILLCWGINDVSFWQCSLSEWDRYVWSWSSVHLSPLPHCKHLITGESLLIPPPPHHVYLHISFLLLPNDLLCRFTPFPSPHSQNVSSESHIWLCHTLPFNWMSQTPWHIQNTFPIRPYHSPASTAGVPDPSSQNVMLCAP